MRRLWTGSGRWIAAALLCAVALNAQSAKADPAAFEPPEPVRIEGYDGHAMEPFLSRDGRLLFFNSRNRPGDQTDIHVADAVSPLLFRYRGPLAGANSEAIDGVPSLDHAGRFYFVSPRAYDAEKRTLWTGVFDGRALRDARLLGGDVSKARAPWLTMDAEISADGHTLYFTDNRWRWPIGGIGSSDIRIARLRADGAFHRPAEAEAMFAAVNTDALEFAPATTPDELTLYFTRAARAALERGDPDGFGLYVAERARRDQPFGSPMRIRAARGYVEAPTVTPDGCALYFHQLQGARFEIMRMRRSTCPSN